MNDQSSAASSTSGILEFGQHQFYVADGRTCVLVLRGEVRPGEIQELAETIDEVNPTARHLAVVCDASELRGSPNARQALSRFRFSAEKRARTLVAVAGAQGQARVAMTMALDAAADSSRAELVTRFVGDRRAAMEAARQFLLEHPEG